MNKTFLWKIILIVVVVGIFAAGIVLGNEPDRAIAAYKQGGLKAAIQQSIHLGLDLKGGTHLILQVMVNDAVNAETDRVIERLKDELKGANLPYAEISKPNTAQQPDVIAIKGLPPEQSGDLRRVVSERFPEYDLASGAENSWTMTLKPSIANDIKRRSVAQAIDTIRGRVDQLGVTEPVIQEHGLGENQILVQLPGVDDPARVKNIMQSTAMLEIRQAVDNTPYESEEAARAAHNGVIPADAVLVHGLTTSRGGESRDSVYLIARTSVVAGADIREARTGTDENGRPAVNFYLTGDAGNRFQRFTSAHIGDYLAVILDNKVREVAVINSAIRDSGTISGGMDTQAAKDLSMILSSGALPASIRYLEERTVGPSLGMDSIRQGVRAAVIGMLAVMIFMLVYYRGAGINADLALVLNLIILLGFLGFTGATLTLPGIAGVILTVGMGVDSNVLIFERIREELRNGKTAAQAVDQGFGHAWLTIVDTHVTTIVSAIILFLFGTGPVRGFAVTLAFGLFANLFTAVFVSRVIFDAELSGKRREALSI